ncbi:hypothetical protein TorRG33x02_344740, partial [Trema orientale]
LPILRLSLHHLLKLHTRALPLFVPLGTILNPIIAMDPPRPLLHFPFEPPPIIQFHSQDPPMELHAVKLHRLHRRLGGRRSRVQNEPETRISLRILMSLDQNHILYRPELAKELGHVVFLDPARQIPHENLPLLPEFDSGRVRILLAAVLLVFFLLAFVDSFRRRRSWHWRRRGRRRRRRELAGEPELLCNRVRILAVAGRNSIGAHEGFEWV